MDQNLSDLSLLEESVLRAGSIAMDYFDGSARVWWKGGESPVSEADYSVNNYLKDHLLSHRPDYGWLSEESDDDLTRLKKDRVFVVDPIDGTRGFIENKREWCISVAIVESHRPVVGVLHAPKLKNTFTAILDGGARLNGDLCRMVDASCPFRVSCSSSIFDTISGDGSLALHREPSLPSLALRLAQLAEGSIDLAIIGGHSHDWDIAAADLIVSESGGLVCGLNGDILRYNCSGTSQDRFFSCSLSSLGRVRSLLEHV